MTTPNDHDADRIRVRFRFESDEVGVVHYAWCVVPMPLDSTEPYWHRWCQASQGPAVAVDRLGPTCFFCLQRPGKDPPL